MNKLIDQTIGLYVHIPFCESKCPYCNFYSLSNNDFLIDKYIESVCLSIKKWSEHISKKVDTLYLGGGTPSLIGENRINKIIETAAKYFSLQNPEITIEINPTKGKVLDFNYLKSAGVNRLSVGLQSSNENELKILGRKHTKEDVKALSDSAHKSGFDNISFDLMLAIPNQTEKSLKESIDFCNLNNVSHISMYLLKIEEGTPFYIKQNTLNLPNEEKTVNLYFTACEYLEKYGYKQYEISNFSNPQKESKHNLKYWNCEEYLGIGPSAHSFINGKRFYYPNSLESFINKEKVIQGGNGGEQFEYSMLKLRLTNGIENREFKKRFSCNIPQNYFKNALRYKDKGLVICTKDSIKLTRKGFIVSNELISKILL